MGPICSPELWLETARALRRSQARGTIEPRSPGAKVRATAATITACRDIMEGPGRPIGRMAIDVLCVADAGRVAGKRIDGRDERRCQARAPYLKPSRPALISHAVVNRRTRIRISIGRNISNCAAYAPRVLLPSRLGF